MIKFCSVVGIALLAMAGCSKRQTPEVLQSESTNDCSACIAGDMSSLPDDAIVLKVNGEPITKCKFMVASRFYDKINRLNARQPLTGANPHAEAAVQYRAPWVLNDMLNRTLIRQFAEERQVSYSDVNFKMARSAFYKSFRRSNLSLEEIARLIGGEEGDLVQEYVQGDATRFALLESLDVNHTLEITDDDINVVSNRWIEFNRVATISNAFEKAELAKALDEIANGGSFEEVGRKYSIDLEEVVDWGDFELDDFEDEPELAAWLKEAKIGDVTGVVETDDGWSVIKLTGKEIERDEDEDGLPTFETKYTLSRIVRKAWEIIPDAPREEIVKGLIDARRKALQRQMGDLIMQKAVIEWPAGTNLFPNATLRKSKM